MLKHTKHSWKISLLTCLMAGLMLFAGCSQGSSGNSGNAVSTPAPSDSGSGSDDDGWLGTKDGKTITLRLWAGVPPEYGYDEMAKNFNAEYADRGLQIEYVKYNNDANGNLQLETYLMGGGEIDVFISYGGGGTLKERIDANLCLDMTDYLKGADFDLAKEFGTVNAASYTYNDRIYGFPTKYENNRWMMINKDMFEAAGVNIPYEGWTYDEFLDACEKLTHGEGQDKVHGVYWYYNSPGQWRDMLGSVLGSHATYVDDDCSAVAYDNDIWKQGFEMTMATVDKGWAIPLEDEVSENYSVETTFLKGKAAMSMDISKIRLVMDAEEYPHDFTTALVPGPVPSEKYMTDEYKYHSNYSGAGDIICIANNTGYPAQCFELVMWYVTGGRIPLWNGFDSDAIVAALLENSGNTIDEKSLRNYLAIDKTTATPPIHTTYGGTEISDAFKEEVTAMLYGTQSIDDTIDHIVNRGNKLISEAKAAAGVQ